MPELPEVKALAEFLGSACSGRVIRSVEVGSISALKTYDPAVTSLAGLEVCGVNRYGKFIDVDIDGLHLVFHLARAGWLRWYDRVPTTRLRPGGSAIALRVQLGHLDDAADAEPGPGWQLTEAGTQKSLAIYVTRDVTEIPGIARLGPDPLEDDFDLAAFRAALGDSGARIKGLLRDQATIAGIGNAYSDEILHVAKMSPFATPRSLTQEQWQALFEALKGTLAEAVASAAGRPAAELKDAKRAAMRVHGRTGEPCGTCADTIREISYSGSSWQYCPRCQTDGKILADRRLSRLVK